MGGDFVESEGIQPIEGRGEADRSFNIGSAGFVAEGEVVVGGAFVGDLFDHFSPAAPRREGFEGTGLAVKNPYSSGSVNLVP